MQRRKAEDGSFLLEVAVAAVLLWMLGSILLHAATVLSSARETKHLTQVYIELTRLMDELADECSGNSSIPYSDTVTRVVEGRSYSFHRSCTWVSSTKRLVLVEVDVGTPYGEITERVVVTHDEQ